jgi:hypothetical protein
VFITIGHAHRFLQRASRHQQEADRFVAGLDDDLVADRTAPAEVVRRVVDDQSLPSVASVRTALGGGIAEVPGRKT